MSGELAAFASAFLWASSTVLLRSLSSKIPIFLLSAGRTLSAGAIYWLFLLVVRGTTGLDAIPLWAAGYVAFAVVVGLMMGDLLFLRGQQLLGVSRALPIAGSYPLVTAVLASVLLDELVTPRMLVGIVITLAGVYLVAQPPRGRLPDTPVKETNLAGVAIALAASLCWALASISLKPAVEVIDPILANAVRLPIAGLLLTGLASTRSHGIAIWRFGPQLLVLVAVTGVLHAFSSGFYLMAIQGVGAAKASTLTSTAPLFAAPLAIIFGKERPAPLTIVGTILSVAGIYLVL